MAKALSVMQVLNKNNRVVEFDGPFLELIGNPELSGAWFIWGQSGNGKTAFFVQLLKYLSKFARVAINSLEEGTGETLKKAYEREKMWEVNGRIITLDKEPIEELKERLRQKKSPRIIGIDSWQYTQMKYSDYIALKEEFPRKLFVFTSHAEGKLPKGKSADDVRFDASVKIRVEGFKAFAQSRYNTDEKAYIIWPQGAEMYWAKV